MTASELSPSSSDDPLQQAAHWFVLLASGDAGDDDRARWLRWRAADPAHEKAWARVESASALFSAVPSGKAAAALQALSRKTIPARSALLSLLLAGVLGVGGWQGYRASDWSADAVTAVGQQREMQLEDGSRLLLDTDTAIDIEFDGEQRRLRLRRGRLFVATGHLPEFAAQPFRVATAQVEATALGTQFSVQQQLRQTRVVVIESRVELRTPDGEHLILEQGHSAVVGNDGVRRESQLLRNDSAWQRGMLIAEDMPLNEFLAELGRYHHGELQCDPAVAQLRISGAFPLSDTGQLLVALAETLPVRIERDQSGRVRVLEK